MFVSLFARLWLTNKRLFVNIKKSKGNANDADKQNANNTNKTLKRRTNTMAITTTLQANSNALLLEIEKSILTLKIEASKKAIKSFDTERLSEKVSRPVTHVFKSVLRELQSDLHEEYKDLVDGFDPFENGLLSNKSDREIEFDGVYDALKKAEQLINNPSGTTVPGDESEAREWNDDQNFYLITTTTDSTNELEETEQIGAN